MSRSDPRDARGFHTGQERPLWCRSPRGPCPPIGRSERAQNRQLCLPRDDPQDRHHLGSKVWDFGLRCASQEDPDEMGLGCFPGTTGPILSRFSPISPLSIVSPGPGSHPQ